jgi:hypothetical protein
MVTFPTRGQHLAQPLAMFGIKRTLRRLVFGGAREIKRLVLEDHEAPPVGLLGRGASLGPQFSEALFSYRRAA